jgi:hypothetical protein
MNDLYYGVHPFVDAAEAGFAFDMDVLKAAVKRVYERKFNPMTEIDEGVFNETWRVFNEAAAKGFADAGASGDEEFFEQIKHNNAVFSAFRTHRLQNDIASRLLDENGKLKTFEQFSNDVKGITDHSVKQWLRTEYDTAVIRAHNAADWQRFASVKDVLPNLRWMQTTSVTPDEIHRQFWSAGLTLPQEHPFWKLHRPGDRWNCKCYLEATDAPVRGEHLYEHPATPYKPAKGLDVNAGTTGQLFSDTHPYNPPSCAACTLPGKKVLLGKPTNRLSRFFNSSGKKDCYRCSKPLELLRRSGIATKVSKQAAEELSKKRDKFIELFVEERRKIQKSHIKERDLQFDNLQTGHITISKKTTKAILHLIFSQAELNAALVINRNIGKLIFIRESPLGEGKDTSNPIDVANINKKIAKGVVRFNSYEYRHKGNVFYVKTEVIVRDGKTFEQLYTFTKKP